MLPVEFDGGAFDIHRSRAGSVTRRYETFAMSHAGDAGRGRAAFMVCAACHGVDGSGSRIGPDLGRIGDNFRRQDLIRAILEPSAFVAVGFGATSIETKAGEARTGIVKSATAELLEMMGVDGKLVKIPVSEIKSQQHKSSLLEEKSPASRALHLRGRRPTWHKLSGRVCWALALGEPNAFGWSFL